MTTLAPTARRVVLADRVFPRTLLMDVVLVVAGAALVTVLAQVAIPLWPVPITGQTLAVLLVGSTLGWARGAISMVLYALLGLVGLPIYSDGTHGATVLFGATGGYIVGFIVSAALVGWLAERQWDRKILKAIVTFVAGSVVVFAIGLPWLAVVLRTDLQTTLEYGLYPFIVGGIIKAAIAAALLPLAWWGADRIATKRRAENDAA
ncbi:MAG TPA: biotin transporter BioY [Pseudolysinimonas sp.]|jgi:biotin transport system substrate-specific component